LLTVIATISPALAACTPGATRTIISNPTCWSWDGSIKPGGIREIAGAVSNMHGEPGNMHGQRLAGPGGSSEIPGEAFAGPGGSTEIAGEPLAGAGGRFAGAGG
jgi:hypothetical protein